MLPREEKDQSHINPRTAAILTDTLLTASKNLRLHSKCDTAIPANQLTNLVLHSLKPRIPTGLAFKMVNYTSQALKVHSTRGAGTVIQRLLVYPPPRNPPLANHTSSSSYLAAFLFPGTYVSVSSGAD